MVQIFKFFVLFFFTFQVSAQQKTNRVKSKTVTRSFYNEADSLLYSSEIISLRYNKNGDTIQTNKIGFYPAFRGEIQRTKQKRNKKTIRIKRVGEHTEIKKYAKNGQLVRWKKINSKQSHGVVSFKITLSTYAYNSSGNRIEENHYVKKKRCAIKKGWGYTYQYDDKQHKIESNYFIAKDANPITVQYKYNDQGLLFEEWKRNSKFVYRYDFKDSLVSKSNFGISGKDSSIISWKQFTYTDSSYTVLNLKTRESKTYLNTGQLLRYCMPNRDSTCYQFKYNAAGKELESIIIRPDSTIISESNQYNEQGLLVKKIKSQITTTYAYESNGLLVNKEEYKRGKPYSTTVYTYNDLGQLIKQRQLFSEDFDREKRAIITEFKYTYF